MVRSKSRKSVKIVATLGPSSSDIGTISDLILAGVNVIRVNMSHGTHEGHAALIETVREASNRTKLEVAILADLQGPKIRVDKLPEPLQLNPGETWVIGPTSKQADYPQYENFYIPTTYEDLVKDCEDGARLLFDDGLMSAKAICTDSDVLKIEIIVGGVLKSNKGINLPDTKVSAPSFTEKDQADFEFAMEHDIDYVALSFVRKKEDILQVREQMKRYDRDVPIISKIENPEGIENLDEILDVSDVIMVARGDMGVELGNFLVPSLQKKIIHESNRRGLPVITATQMLESMIENSTPTRAEASDVANAVWDGTDAVMLSGETAVGAYPVKTVEMMTKIIVDAEQHPQHLPEYAHEHLDTVEESAMLAASFLAESVDAKRLLAVTQSGYSCLKLSQFRSPTSILGVSNDLYAVRKMCLYWGVSPFYLDKFDEDHENLEEHVIAKVEEECQLVKGDKIVITRGRGAFFSKGNSNSIRVEVVA